MDYHQLDSVTKSDTYPLPRIDDLLDLLGKAWYFSTLDLASGYWQVQVHHLSREKTTFVTHQGLYEFAVMPFGLKNAPALFQRLIQRVLIGLNPSDGHDFVFVYLDVVLVFSETFNNYLEHLALVLQRFASAGLKLKPLKCHFICQSVEYLGHLITPGGIQPNPNCVSAVQDFSRPSSVKEVRKFLGLASYYRRFIAGFAKVAHPLHSLTQKDAVFQWSPSCQTALETLTKLIQSPVLSFPDLSRSFRIETDVSLQGLGAVSLQGLGAVLLQGLGAVSLQGLGAVSLQGLGAVLLQGLGAVLLQGLGAVSLQGLGAVLLQGLGAVLLQGLGAVSLQGLGAVSLQGLGAVSLQGLGAVLLQGLGAVLLQGLGAVLSQLQSNGEIHPVAYASRALSATEKRYAITELETLAVVWAVTHFPAYLYGNDVTIYTDHSAVKAVMETPNPSSKHARWRSKVYDSGVRSITSQACIPM